MKYRTYQIYSAIIIILSILFTFQTNAEEEGAVTVTSSFLRISADARGAAMGDAQGVVTEDVYSMYWNPAGLSKTMLREVGMTYQKAFQGLDYGFIGYAAPIGSFGTLAGQFFFLSSGSITATYEDSAGSFSGIGDSFSVIDFGLGISQSKEIVENLSYGLSAKLLFHKIKDEQAFSLAADMGIIYRDVMKNLDLGGVLQNLSTSYRFMTQDLYEPRNLKLASLYSFLEHKLLFAADYNLTSGQRDTLNFGGEYWAFDLIALRAGMKLPPPAGFISSLSIGFGLNWRDTYRLDYSYSLHSELGANQRFSIIARF